MTAPVRTAVIPAGGLGTRFLPATRAIPKEMLPIVDKPLIQYAVEEARAAGIERIVLVTARGKTAIVDHFDEAPELQSQLEAAGKMEAAAVVRAAIPPPGSLLSVRQQQPLGLGHAVWCARAAVGDAPFAVVLPDDLILGPRPCLAQMVEAHAATDGALLAVMPVAREFTNRYGIVDPARHHGDLVAVAGLVEKPAPDAAPSDLAIIGRYILPAAVFEHLGHHRRGAGGEIQLTDAIAGLIGATPVHGFRFAGQRFDCGSPAGFLEATVACALAREELANEARAILTRRLGQA